MTLYHLTAEQNWELILESGEIISSQEKRNRRIGGFYAPQRNQWDVALDSLVWLTTNPSPRQGWMVGGAQVGEGGRMSVVPEPPAGPMHKGKVVIEVEVPEAEPWPEYAKRIGFPGDYYEALAAVPPRGDPREWYVTPGPIPKERWLLAMRTTDRELLYGKHEAAKIGGAISDMLTLKGAEHKLGIPYEPRVYRQITGEQHIVGAHLLLDFAGEFLGVDEATVTRSLHPLYSGDFTNQVEVHSSFVGLLRSASIYQLDWDEIKEAILSEPPSKFPELPPLPFARLWIEATTLLDPRRPGGVFPCSLLSFEPPAGNDLDLNLLGCGIVERVPGERWDVYLPFDLGGEGQPEPDHYNVVAFHVGPDGILEHPLGEIETEERRTTESRRILGLAVTLAHIITARGVPKRHVMLPRAQRKRFERRHPYYPRAPRIYYVDLAAAAEEPRPGSGDREYHVRWIVSGHWYHVPAGRSGQRACTCCSPPREASWVEPYVKGPAGAPWKGRPVHRQAHREEDEAA